MKFYSMTHKGHIRQNNEDSILTGDYYAVVADGMGGHNAGDVASKLIVDSIAASFADKSVDDITSRDVKKAISDANKEVWSNAKRNTERKGMGSTATLAVFKGSKVFIGQVGDSRAYKFSQGILTQITKDHSYVQELIDAGHISEHEAGNHPKRNVITRAVGAHIDIETDFFAVDIKNGDIIMLCSDGLISCVSDSEIAQILAGEIETAAYRLVDAALNYGGADNISVIIAVAEVTKS